MGVLKVLPSQEPRKPGSQWGHEQGRYPNAHILSEISEKLCDVVCVCRMPHFVLSNGCHDTSSQSRTSRKSICQRSLEDLHLPFTAK